MSEMNGSVGKSFSVCRGDSHVLHHRIPETSAVGCKNAVDDQKQTGRGVARKFFPFFPHPPSFDKRRHRFNYAVFPCCPDIEPEGLPRQVVDIGMCVVWRKRRTPESVFVFCFKIDGIFQHIHPVDIRIFAVSASRRQIIVIGVRIHGKSQIDLFLSGETADRSSLLPGRIQGGKKHSGKNGDDCNRDEQLHKGENLFFPFH